ncbi:hypothetical protein F4677DRAFT_452700 [Hypoxylon crocopeplum]|nr:hypothetical protein F4677DRAFT_452700 [Hypoxylon crocopeplum]
MHRNSYTSSGGPPPPYGYGGYDQSQQSPHLPPSDGSSRQWNDPHAQQDRRNDYQFRGPFSDMRQTRPDDRQRSNEDHRDRDNYRPPQGDFTFRVDRPPGIDSYRPPEREQRPSRNYGDERNGSYHPRRPENERPGGRDGRPRRPDDRRRQQRPQRRAGIPQRGNGKAPVIPSNRLLLLKKHDDNPELMLGDTAGRATYRDVEELSDSDEAAMDISDNSESDAAEPASKRARTSAFATAKPEQDIPKWSNPDPYTALPPPDESSRKKKDMVQLIRKARVEAEAKKPAAQVEGLDFISCDLSDNEGTGEKEGRYGNGGRSVTGSGESRTSVYDGGVVRGAGTYAVVAGQEPLTHATAMHRIPSTLPPKPQISFSAHIESTDTRTQNITTRGTRNNPIDLTPDTSLGNRKRTFDDAIKQPHQAIKQPSKMMATPGNLAPLWRWTSQDGNPCPWTLTSYSAAAVGTRLHLEIAEFYQYVGPRDFEERIRNQLVANLRKVIKKKWPDADIYPFGSFMSRLYLPSSDMDIAICSDSFINKHVPYYDKKGHLWSLKSHLLQYGVAAHGAIEVIPKAKVPLVKYTDNQTGLKVDISFEKLDGHQAIDTFLSWKEKYPSMPTIVALIKQFLLMRGLNEPVSGGIGGFSVICMVVHVLDQMPQIQSGAMNPEDHLGETLMEFFDYYGNRFQYETVAICMDPPGVVPKAEVSQIVYRNLDRLSIIDPNNPGNDIAGGSKNTVLILSHFSHAFSTLQGRMARLTSGPLPGDFGNTVLGPLFAGNYTIFEDSRKLQEKLVAEGIPEYRPSTHKNEPRW